MSRRKMDRREGSNANGVEVERRESERRKTKLAMNISFKENAIDAVKFYEGVFNVDAKAKLGKDVGNDAQPNVVYHSVFPFGISEFYVSDNEKMTAPAGNISISLISPNESTIRNIYEKLADGGNVILPLEKSFFADLAGQVVDKLGIKWFFIVDSKEANDCIIPDFGNDGNASEALELYTKAFNTVSSDQQLYGAMPPMEGMPKMPDDNIMHVKIHFNDHVMALSDYSDAFGITKGDNIEVKITLNSIEAIELAYNTLKDEVIEELREEFWAERFARVKDKFGVIWHLEYNPKQV